MQVCADGRNPKGMYDGIKQGIGPMQSRTAPLKSATGDAIKDKSKQNGMLGGALLWALLKSECS